MDMNDLDTDQLTGVVYVSSATRIMSVGELEEFLLDARTANEQYAITGVLLYSEGSFMQYFEGPLPSIGIVYRRIKASRRHTHLIEMIHEPIQARLFADWRMGFAQRQRSDELRASSSGWEDVVRASNPVGEPAAKHLLLDFWANAR